VSCVEGYHQNGAPFARCNLIDSLTDFIWPRHDRFEARLGSHRFKDIVDERIAHLKGEKE
jgi:hypothetical protein